ncbi:DNA polymerase III subunit gamma/tau [Coprobacter tertius]|uniref:DNA polymerase III subunit gamma/tau n=1 Tax=Coprobacter tertius TaxID=2944915 RepID=A0ABT1MIA2_9BACT|nr:DNA polymerase III subunit gamma/tau [Coprobacter tertius]MCP9612350.1 DNA polymerase III subunit gamma/tau [Coprobacter tertius]
MDNYIVSARKYRPSTFRSVVGQKALTQTLKNAIDSHKLAHAYLFCGPRGVGKTTCARIFAKTINCLHPTENGEACNECESCKAFNEQRSYNISELDAASNNSVEDIRQLIEQVRVAPQIGKYKVFIIDEVHMLSAAAFNAFLKTLEEPPRHAIFILATTEKNKLLPTILSRCQIYDFQRITIADTIEHLQYVASSEGIQAETEALNIIAQKADGGMRDALSIFDQVVSSTRGNVTYEAVIENLNVLDYEYYFRLTDAFLRNEVPDALLIFNKILCQGFEAQYFISGLSNHFRNLLVCKDPSTLSLLEVGPSVAERYGKQALQCDTGFLYKAMELSNDCDLAYRASNNKRLLVELTLIRICQLSSPIPPTEKTQDPVLGKVSPSRSSNPEGGIAGTKTGTIDNRGSVAEPQAGISKQVSQTVSEPVERKAVVPVPEPAAAISKTAVTRMAPPTISIKKPQGIKEDNKPKEAQLVEMNESFSNDDLQRAWIQFTKTIPSETVLVNTMISCRPVMTDPTHFEVVVDNQAQLDLMQAKGTQLMTFLKNTLKNTHIAISVRESQRQERQKAFSQREKLNLMARKNPYVQQFADKFGLELA